ncbi:MAG: helix-turn-helix transcriptional regulator [Clostridia bacterium]|nr:helix-turn-helix transcriptional regulator [Clostridia bacterium]
MMEKDTGKLLKELGRCENFKSFYEENEGALIRENLAKLLEELFEKKGLKKSRVVRESELSEVYAYQIFSGLRIPERKKLLSLAVAMGLEFEELQGLLRCAGYPPLYVKRPFDCIFLYGLMKKMSILEINELLYQYGQETLK